MAQKTSFQVTQMIALGGKRAGTLSFVPGGFDFESKKGKMSVQSKDISGLVWAVSGNAYQLRLLLKPTGAHSFVGFSEDDLPSVEAHARSLGKALQTRARNVAGYNWGEFEVQGNHLLFEVEKATSFEVPLSHLTQCVVQGKNEVALEMEGPDDADQSCALVEMRVHVPPVVDKKSQEEVPGAEEFSKYIIDSADLGKQKVEAIATFDQVNFQVPRGKYQIELFPSELKLHGATFHYRIAYKNITILVLLDQPDSGAHFFVIGLNPPIRQGQTSYAYLLIQFKSDEEMRLAVNMEEKKIEAEYKNLIKPVMQGKTHDICSRLFKAVTKRKLIVPQSFQSSAGQHYVRCSYKANDGWLYVLEKSFFFIKKPTMWIRHDEIDSVEFARLQGGTSATKSFDVVFNMTNGVVFTFSGINRAEHAILFDFMQAKRLNILNAKEAADSVVRMSESGRGRARQDVDYSEDPYMMKLNAEAARGAGGDDSDDSEDEDYTAKSDSSDDDVSEGPDEEEEGEEGKEAKSGKRKRDSDEGGKKKKKRKKDKKEKKEKKKDKKEKDKSKKSKKSKAPKGLKLPQSAFQLYCNEVRSAVAKENPDLKSTEINKLLTDRWAKLSSDDQSPYEELARKEKARYQEQLAALPQAMSDDEGAGGI